MTTPAKQLKKDRSTGGAARLWALAALLLAVFLGSLLFGAVWGIPYTGAVPGADGRGTAAGADRPGKLGR